MKERLVTCNEKDTDGRARVTTDEERVLPDLDLKVAVFLASIDLVQL